MIELYSQNVKRIWTQKLIPAVPLEASYKLGHHPSLGTANQALKPHQQASFRRLTHGGNHMEVGRLGGALNPRSKYR